MPKRRAERFAGRAGHPERPHRQVPRRGGARRPRAAMIAHQLVQRRDLAAGQDVGAARGRRHRARTAGSPRRDRRCTSGGRRFRRRRGRRIGGARRRETASAAGDRPGRRCRVGRTIDELDAASARRGSRATLFAFELRHLVDVAGPQRRVLVGRRMLDVAVHADGAAVDDAADAGARRPLRSARRPRSALTAR